MRALLLNKTFNLEQKNASELQSAHLYYERFHLGSTAINPCLTARFRPVLGRNLCLVFGRPNMWQNKPTAKKIKSRPKIGHFGPNMDLYGYFPTCTVRSTPERSPLCQNDPHRCPLVHSEPLTYHLGASSLHSVHALCTILHSR